MGVILERKKRILLNEPHIVTTTPAGIANFSTDLISPLKSCKVEFSPVQSGSGDPSPDNVRPISGWTGCNVLRTGKNLFDSSAIIENRYLDGNGEVVPNTSWDVSDYIRVGGTFSVSGYSDTGNAPRWCWYDVGKTFLSAFKPQNDSDTLTPPTGAAYLRMSVRKEKVSDIQVELGSTATPYEPYTGSTIPIDWTTEAGTVYGGYADLVSGELVATYGSVELNSLTWRWTSAEYFHSSSVQNMKTWPSYYHVLNWYCNTYTIGTTNSKPQHNNEVTATLNSSQLRIQDDRYTADTPSFINSLNGVVLVYELATPITYQLTPAQLKSLRGVNNIWSDANGDTTVKYWTH